MSRSPSEALVDERGDWSVSLHGGWGTYSMDEANAYAEAVSQSLDSVGISRTYDEVNDGWLGGAELTRGLRGGWAISLAADRWFARADAVNEAAGIDLNAWVVRLGLVSTIASSERGVSLGIGADVGTIFLDGRFDGSGAASDEDFSGAGATGSGFVRGTVRVNSAADVRADIGYRVGTVRDAEFESGRNPFALFEVDDVVDYSGIFVRVGVTIYMHAVTGAP